MRELGAQLRQERLKRGSRMPGWVKRADFDWYATLPKAE